MSFSKFHSGYIWALGAGVLIGALSVFGGLNSIPRSPVKVETKTEESKPRIWEDEEAGVILKDLLGVDQARVIRWKNGNIRGYYRLLNLEAGKEVEQRLDLDYGLSGEGFNESEGWLAITKRLVDPESKFASEKTYDVTVTRKAEWWKKKDNPSSDDVESRVGYTTSPLKQEGRLTVNLEDSLGYVGRSGNWFGEANTEVGAKIGFDFPSNSEGYWFLLEFVPNTDK